jgi:hypothetical protein
LFERNKQAFEDLTLDEEFGEDGFEEGKENDDDDDTDFKYDRALYDDAGEEDVDFD